MDDIYYNTSCAVFGHFGPFIEHDDALEFVEAIFVSRSLRPT